MPILRVKSVKIYTGQKNLHEYVRGVRDKYQVCSPSSEILLNFFPKFAFSHTAAVTATARHLNAFARFRFFIFALLCFNFRPLLCFLILL